MSREPKAFTEFSKKIRRVRFHDDSRKQQLKKVPGIMASFEPPCKPSFLTNTSSQVLSSSNMFSLQEKSDPA